MIADTCAKKRVRRKCRNERQVGYAHASDREAGAGELCP
jgi:hypothetical protein